MPLFWRREHPNAFVEADPSGGAQVYSVPDSWPIPHIPRWSPNPSGSNDINFRDVFSLSWGKSGSCQSGFVPCVLDQDDPILGPLAIDTDKPPLVEMPGGLWTVRPAVVKEWTYLEQMLRGASHALVTHLSREMLFPLDFTFLQPATSLKLSGLHTNKKAARSVALRARKCLVLDAALVSLLVALWELNSKTPGTWDQMLSSPSHGNMHPANVDRIRASDIVSWSPGVCRVGTILQSSVQPWTTSILQAYRYAKAPLFIWCGPAAKPRIVDAAYVSSGFVPPRLNGPVDRAEDPPSRYIREPILVRSILKKDFISPSAVPQQVSEREPGETVQEYIARRTAQNEEAISGFSDHYRSFVIARADVWSYGVGKALPKPSNPALPLSFEGDHWEAGPERWTPRAFLWEYRLLEDTSETSSEWVCTLVIEDYVETFWNSPGTYRVWYDVIGHELHFIPHTSAEPEASSRTNDLDDLNTVESAIEPHRPHISSIQHYQIAHENALDDPHVLDNAAIISAVSQGERAMNPDLDIVGFLKSRFGFYVDPTVPHTFGEGDLPWEEVCMVWGFPEAEVKDVALQETIMTFTESVRRRRQDIFLSLWDCSTVKANSSLSVTKVITEQEDPSKLGHNPKKMIPRIRYLLKSAKESWCILLEDATSVFQCLRMSTSTCEELALYLGTRFVRFSTRYAFAGPTLPQRHVTHEVEKIDHYAKHLGLGWRGPQYEGDAYDARRYLFELSQWSRTSRARAAVLAGGILSALVGPMIDPRSVILGPSRWAREYGYGDVFVDNRGQEWIDDKLTDNEKDFICGTYWSTAGKVSLVSMPYLSHHFSFI